MLTCRDQIYRQRRNLRLWPSHRLHVRLLLPREHPLPVPTRLRLRHRYPSHRLALLANPEHPHPAAHSMLSARDRRVCPDLEVRMGPPSRRACGRILADRLLRTRGQSDYHAGCRKRCRRNQKELHGGGCVRGLLCWKHRGPAASEESDEDRALS